MGAAAALPLQKLSLLSQSERQALPWARQRQLESVLKGQALVDGWEVDLRVGLSARFPLVLPQVQWVAGGPEGQVPHLEFDQNLCFAQSEGLLIDGACPQAVIVQALEQAQETLRRGWLEPQYAEFLEEFGAYWGQTQREALPVLHSFFTPGEKVLELLAWEERDLHTSPERRKQVRSVQFRRVATDVGSVRRYDGRAPRNPSHTALYIPLASWAQLRPPAPNRPWTGGELRDLVRSQLDSEVLNQLDGLLEQRHRTQDLMVLRIPRSGGQGTLVAVQLKGLGLHPHPLSGGAEPYRLERLTLHPMRVERLDPDFIRARGGGPTGLGEKRVLLVGAGSVGGHLAFMLASAGIGHLTVIDSDTFSPHNTFRHALGRRAVGKRKATALAAELEATYPYLEASPEVAWLDEALDRKAPPFRLENFDLVISATGESTAELDLSARLRRLPQPERPAALYTWLEPLGIGGHCAVTLPDQPGCLRCLYAEATGLRGEWLSLHNRAAFYAPGQSFARDTVGCGTAYTPFADLDARRTAELAAETALEVFRGRVLASEVRSWKGDASSFQSAGFKLAPRHTLSTEQLRQGMSLIDWNCPVCRGMP